MEAMSMFLLSHWEYDHTPTPPDDASLMDGTFLDANRAMPNLPSAICIIKLVCSIPSPRFPPELNLETRHIPS